MATFYRYKYRVKVKDFCGNEGWKTFSGKIQHIRDIDDAEKTLKHKFAGYEMEISSLKKCLTGKESW